VYVQAMKTNEKVES